MQRFRELEDPPEEYEEEFSDVEDVCADDDDYPKGSVVPINPEITDHIDRLGGTWERCKVCGSDHFMRFDGHWVCAYDYVEYLTNIQF